MAYSAKEMKIKKITKLTIHTRNKECTGEKRRNYKLAFGQGSDTFLLLLLLTFLNYHHHYQSLNREGRWGTTDDFATSFLHFSLYSTAL